MTVPNTAALLDDLGRRFDTGTGFSVATLNLDHVVKLTNDPDFQSAYTQHTHVTADGHPIVWLSRLAGQKDISLVPGSELILPLAALAAEKGVPIAFFGATDASLTKAAGALSARFPDLNIVTTLAPGAAFDPSDHEADATIVKLAASGARMVFVALGAPKQECFVARAQTAMPGAGFVSIGAGLDFIAGTQTRAPAWVRKIAAEWLWRLLGNPRRLARRYGACLRVVPALILRALAHRRLRRA